MLVGASDSGADTTGTSALDGFGNLGSLRLQCPRCRARISNRRCLECNFTFREDKGVLQALPPERIVHFAHFIDDYERIREAEGRGSADDAFYLALPFNDTSGRNQRQWQIRACTYECLIHHVLKPRLRAGARILDLGSGNCWLSFRLALEGYCPVAVDLLTNARDGLEAAAHYRGYLTDFFPRFRAELTRLPFEDGQFDAVIFNASFHYAESAATALEEALRCTDIAGIVIIADSPWYLNEESGVRMVSERHAQFRQTYGTASGSIESIEFLTEERLHSLEKALRIQWTAYSPTYGFRWAMRPLIAKLRHRREPARFRIYVAQRASV